MPQAPPQAVHTLAAHRQHRTSPAVSTTAALKAITATARPRPHSNTAAATVASNNTVGPRASTVEHSRSTAKASTALRQATVDSPNSTEVSGSRVAQVATAHKLATEVLPTKEEVKAFMADRRTTITTSTTSTAARRSNSLPLPVRAVAMVGSKVVATAVTVVNKAAAMAATRVGRRSSLDGRVLQRQRRSGPLSWTT